MAGLAGDTSVVKKEEDPDFDPFLNREVKRPTGDVETLLHLLKGFIGTGILALPQGFMFTGLLNGTISTVFLAFVISYAIHVLMTAEYKIGKTFRVGIMDYQAAMMNAVLMGPVKTRRFSKLMGIMVDVFMVVLQVGSACSYMVFVSQNIGWFARDYSATASINDFQWSCILLPLFVLTVMLPDLKYLVPLSLLGNICTLVSFSIVCYYVFLALPPISHCHLYRLNSNYARYFGYVLFGLQSIGVTVAAENNMKHPQNFLGICGVFNINMFIVTAIYILLAFCGYWRYGVKTQDSITLNLPTAEIPAKISVLCYTLAIFLSYSLQIYVSNIILWRNYLVKLFKNSTPFRLDVYEYIFRFLCVLLTFGISTGIPHFGLIISLIGCLSVSSLGFLFPALIDLCARWYDGGDGGDGGVRPYRRWFFCRDVVLIIFGLLGLVIGTYCNVRRIVLTVTGHKEVFH